MSFLPCYNLYHTLFSFFFLPFIPSYLTHISFTFPVSHICRALRVLYFLFIYTTPGHRTTTPAPWEGGERTSRSEHHHLCHLSSSSNLQMQGWLWGVFWGMFEVRSNKGGWDHLHTHHPPFKTNKLELELILFKTKRLFPQFLFNLMASTTTLERRW